MTGARVVPELVTARCRLVPATLPLIRSRAPPRPAAAEAAIGAAFPEAWPNDDLVARAFPFRSKRSAPIPDSGCGAIRWCCRRRAALSSAASCSAVTRRWRRRGRYGIEDGSRRQGLAAEATLACVEWALAQPGIRAVQATTFPWHEASLGVIAGSAWRRPGTPPDRARRARRATRVRAPALAPTATEAASSAWHAGAAARRRRQSARRATRSAPRARSSRSTHPSSGSESTRRRYCRRRRNRSRSGTGRRCRRAHRRAHRAVVAGRALARIAIAVLGARGAEPAGRERLDDARLVEADVGAVTVGVRRAARLQQDVREDESGLGVDSCIGTERRAFLVAERGDADFESWPPTIANDGPPESPSHLPLPLVWLKQSKFASPPGRRTCTQRPFAARRSRRRRCCRHQLRFRRIRLG